MRPDDRRPTGDGAMDGFDVPFDAGLEGLDAELEAAGALARRGLHGRTQPTRSFSIELRARLLGTFPAPAAAITGGTAALQGRSLGGSRLRSELGGDGQRWAPIPVAPRVARRTPTILPRARWVLPAAALLTVAVVAGALGARLDWILPPVATASPTLAPEPTPDDPARPTAAIVLPIATPSETDPGEPASEAPMVAPTPSPKAEPTPRVTPKPTPKVTPKPEPTSPPIGPMELFALACPGGVVLDWTKPSPAVGHYHSLRKLDGDVPPTYPGDGTTEIDSATSWNAGVTDGFDAGAGGGEVASYRAFAFDADDHQMAASPMRTVTTVARIDLGTLSIETLGAGSMAVSWSAAEVSADCFTYGKLVASETDPTPSYLDGSPYLAVIGDNAATGVTLEGLPSGKTVWMRYEVIRTTSLGKFVVARTDVVQVTFP